MRMMLRITIPTETGNRALKDGTFQKVMDATIAKVKPEASYFVANQGCRCAMLFFDMADPSEIPAIAEPLFMDLSAELEIVPVMNADELSRGLATAVRT